MLSETERSRLESLPAEMQAVKFLHDMQYILSEEYDDPEWKAFMDYANHADIVFYHPKKVPGYTRLMAADVKEHDERYKNLLLETQTRKDADGKRRPSWALCDFANYPEQETKGNRLLIYVEEGPNKSYFREIMRRENLIDDRGDEKQNRVQIMEYFAGHQELLDRSVTVYTIDDINEYIMETGGYKIEDRTGDILIATGVMVRIVDWAAWDRKYRRDVYNWNGQEWILDSKGVSPITDVLRRHPITPVLQPIWHEESTEYKYEYRSPEEAIDRRIDFFAERQKGELTLENFKNILGMKIPQEIIDRYNKKDQDNDATTEHGIP